VIEGVKRTGGTAVSVSDEEILEAVRSLARYEGVFAEPSGAAALAGAKKLLEDGVIDENDKVVVLVTGSGLKDPEIASRITPSPPEIQPDPSHLERILPQLLGSS
jgi:threonine synthase